MIIFYYFERINAQALVIILYNVKKSCNLTFLHKIYPNPHCFTSYEINYSKI